MAYGNNLNRISSNITNNPIVPYSKSDVAIWIINQFFSKLKRVWLASVKVYFCNNPLLQMWRELTKIFDGALSVNYLHS